MVMNYREKLTVMDKKAFNESDICTKYIPLMLSKLTGNLHVTWLMVAIVTLGVHLVE